MTNLVDRGIYPVMIAELGESPKLVMVFDAVTEESHQQVSEITEHPIEDGSVIADFIIQKPLELTISIIKSNMPITFFDQSRFSSVDLSPYSQIGEIISSVSALSSNPQIAQKTKNTLGASYIGRTLSPSATAQASNYPTNQAIKAYETISNLQKLGKSLKIYTGLRIYSNMVITNISSKRDIGNADSWEATISLKEIRSVSSYSTNSKLKANTAKAGSPKDRNTKPVQKKSEVTKELSYLDSFITADYSVTNKSGMIYGTNPTFPTR